MSKSNVEKIITKLEKELPNYKYKKIDGITLEVEFNEANSVIENNLINICKKLKLNSPQIEFNKEFNNKLALQFPDLDVTYNKEEIDKLFNNHFKWLLDNMFHNDIHNELNDKVIEANIQILVKQIITIYYKSNTNQYKETLEDYINNTEFRKDIEQRLLNFYKEYKFLGNRVIIDDKKENV